MTVKYSKDHEGVRVEGATAVVGISDYAQTQLGDVVYVEVPEVGRKLEQGKEAAVVESVKAASESMSPSPAKWLPVTLSSPGGPARATAIPLGAGGSFT